MLNRTHIRYSLALLLAAEAAAADLPHRSIQFGHLELGHDHLVDGVRTAASVSINGTPYPLQFRPILRTGQRLTGETFGLLKDIEGEPLQNQSQEPRVCRSLSRFGAGPDFTSLIKNDTGMFATTQFECAPGATYVARLIQHRESGLLEAASLRYLDVSSVRGGMYHCAGTVTPWNTHLGSEEMEPNARAVDPVLGKSNLKSAALTAMQDYLRDKAEPNPYAYGWVTEIRPDGAFAPSTIKHYSLGRFSHELAYVLPDQKTVYLTDDTTNGGLFMFVADKRGELDSGTLYAARWRQVSDHEGGKADLDWINLGHAQAGEIAAFVDKQPKFHHLFFTAERKPDGSCPTDFKPVSTHDGAECLRVRDGLETFASRLEARRYAALVGATTEFRKAEGLTYSASRNKVFLAISEITEGMRDNDPRDIEGANHIRLAKNECGAIFELALDDKVKDGAGRPIDSQSVATVAKAILSGRPAIGPEGKAACDVNGIANPDNVAYIPEADALMIGEDTERHRPNVLWAYDLRDGSLHRVLAAPRSAEVTSIYWYPNIDDWAYLTVVIQHPWAQPGGSPEQIPPELRYMTESIVGYLGPFPATNRASESHTILPR